VSVHLIDRVSLFEAFEHFPMPSAAPNKIERVYPSDRFAWMKVFRADSVIANHRASAAVFALAYPFHGRKINQLELIVAHAQKFIDCLLLLVHNPANLRNFDNAISLNAIARAGEIATVSLL
jgi:hypothetical protein